MKEGFLIGGGLIFAGLMLELSVGPVNWDAFRWPVNGKHTVSGTTCNFKHEGLIENMQDMREDISWHLL